jgi:hypothetical protein
VLCIVAFNFSSDVDNISISACDVNVDPGKFGGANLFDGPGVAGPVCWIQTLKCVTKFALFEKDFNFVVFNFVCKRLHHVFGHCQPAHYVTVSIG